MMVHDHDHKNHTEPEHILVTSDSYDYLWQMPNELWHFLDCQSSHSKWDKMRMESPKPGQQIVHGQELLNVAKQGKQQSGYHLKTNSAAAPLMAIDGHCHYQWTCTLPVPVPRIAGADPMAWTFGPPLALHRLS
jgi:hypothetical protein